MWAQRHRLARNLALALTFAAIASGIATYVALTGSPPFGPDPNTLLALIIIDLVLLLPLAMLVAQRIVRLWVERRKGRAGSRLHARLVLLFGLLAVTPAIKAAMLIVFAETDERINAMWPAYEAALKAAGTRYEAHFYPGTQHGFHNNSTPRYVEAQAKVAWERTVAHFKQHLA